VPRCRGAAPSPPPSSRGAASKLRREVGDLLVRLVGLPVHRVDEPASPERCRRAFSPPVASSRPRRPGSPSSCSPAARCRPGAVSASVGAPQCFFRRAPPLTVALPPRRRRPCAAPAARFRPRPLDPKPMARIRLKPHRSTSLPVNPLTRARLDPWPFDLDPADQIHSHSFNRAVLLKNPRVFPVSQKDPSTLENPYV
jgi:hypothetical protein